MLWPASDRFGRLAAQPVERRRHAVRALRGRPGRVERIGAEGARPASRSRGSFQIAVGQDRLRHFEPVMRAGLVPQQVRPRPDHRDQRHHQLFADRVDRRVGDLREILLEVVVEQLRLVRQRGNRRVGAHRADRVVAHRAPSARGRTECPPGCSQRLAAASSWVDGSLGRIGTVARANSSSVLLGQVRQFEQVELGRFEPRCVRMLGSEFALDLVVVDDAAFFEVDQQHLARLQPPLADDLLLRDRQYPGLRGHDQMVVVGDDVARRPQAVAVEVAPIWRPSVKAIAAGPSHGSISAAWYS